MAANPYLAAHRRMRRNRRRVEGAGATFGPWLGAALAVGLLVPLVRPVFLSFLDGPPEGLGVGLEAVSVRAGLLVVTVLSLDVFTALIRSPDRAVLDLHPVDPAEVVRFEVVRVASQRAWLIPALGALLSPLAMQGGALGWLLAVGVAAGSFALGLAASAMMHLLAVEVTQRERWAVLLDAARGNNPRAQAAFIYAPGVVLAAAGGLVYLAALGAGRAWSGQPLWALGLLAPLAGAAAAWTVVPPLARGNWFRATAVLADIDARYAALEEREDGERVYLDWMVRFLPAAVGLYALKDLRHGWRARRTWVIGAWLVGVGAALAGWAASPSATGNAAGVVAAGVWLSASVGVLLDRDDPAFLRVWLPGSGTPGTAARLVVLLAWVQGCLWLAVLAVGLRHGGGAALQVLAFGVGSMVVAAPTAAACGRSPRWGLWLYAPLACLAAAGTAALAVTGG